MIQNKITQQTIADKLNLSVATISKALSGHSDVNEDTHTKVINMATKMGYNFQVRPKQAKDLKSAQHNLIGVFILSSEEQWKDSNYFASMSSIYAKMNISLLFHYYSVEDCELILSPEYQPPAMRDGLLSGVILVNQWPPDIAQRLALRTPCVSIINEFQQTTVDMIGVDEHNGIFRLMEHLYNLGHRTIGFFAGTGVSNHDRVCFGAYIASLYRLGLDFEPEFVCGMDKEIVNDKTLTFDLQIKHVFEQIRRGVRAWMCTSNHVGYELYERLTDSGFQIPEEVSITGFGNGQNTRPSYPKLTSMEVPTLNVGAEAVRRLLNRLNHPSSPQLKVKLQCKFIEGATTAAPIENSSAEIS